MNAGHAPPDGPRGAELLALAERVRPELHRYCARLMGSVIEGEDVVQDAFERALVAVAGLDPATPLRPWLFRIAHHRAIDLLRSRAVRVAEPLEAAAVVADPASPDPMETLLRHDAVRTAVRRFAELPLAQRSVVVLKDVLDESLAEIAALLEISVDAVKGHLSRGRARLRELNARPAPPADAAPVASPAVANFATLFNRRDWDALRSLLADDVTLRQSAFPLRRGKAEVSLFFTFYEQAYDAVRLEPGRLEGREVIAVFGPGEARPRYVMWLVWRDGRIGFIRDYRHLPYVIGDAEFVPAGAASG